MKKIVLVDDDPEVLRVLKLGIEQGLKDVEVVPCSSVHEAEQVLEGAEPVHLLVSDIVMPVETGWELVRWLQKQKRFEDLPVVVISGYVTESDVREKAQSLICEFVAKPLDIDKLASLIREKLSA